MNPNDPAGPEIDAILLDTWFPQETTFEAEMKLYWGDWGVASEVDTLRAVLMRRPGKEIEDFDPKVVPGRRPVPPPA